MLLHLCLKKLQLIQPNTDISLAKQSVCIREVSILEVADLSHCKGFTNGLKCSLGHNGSKYVFEMYFNCSWSEI